MGKFDDSSAKLIDAFLHRRSNLELYYDIRQTNVQVIFWIFLLWHSPVWDANKESDRIYIVYSINLLAITIRLYLHALFLSLTLSVLFNITISWTEGPSSGRSASLNNWCCQILSDYPFVLFSWTVHRICMVKMLVMMM